MYATNIKAGQIFGYGFGSVTAATDARTTYLSGRAPSVEVTCFKFGNDGATFVAYFPYNGTVELDPMTRCYAARTGEGYWTCDVPGRCAECQELAAELAR